jgi:hypothetical protein
MERTKQPQNLVPDGGCFYTATASVTGFSMPWDLSEQYWNGYTSHYGGQGSGLTIGPFDLFACVPMQFTYNFTQPAQASIIYSPSDPVQVNCNAPQFCTKFYRYGASFRRTSDGCTCERIDDAERRW